MSRLSPGENNFTPNPSTKFLTFKNYTTKEILQVKGKPKEIKLFDGCGFEWSKKNENDEWENFKLPLPIEFVMIDKDWINFKGWNQDTSTMYWSNEVKNSSDTINIRDKDSVIYSFTLNDMWGVVPGIKVRDEAKKKEIKAKLLSLGVKQHSSLYIAMKNDKDEYELMNIQLKGSNLSGSKTVTPSGWWNVQKEFNKGNKIYSHFIQINDYITEEGEMGEYGILNYTLGELIPSDDLPIIDALAETLENYHAEYAKRDIKDLPEETPEEVDDNDNPLPWDKK